MYHETCYFASDYDEELRSLANPATMEAKTMVVQFPYNQPEVVEKTEEEIAAQLERRKEQGRRLQEMQAKQRAEKVRVLTLGRKLTASSQPRWPSWTSTRCSSPSVDL